MIYNLSESHMNSQNSRSRPQHSSLAQGGGTAATADGSSTSNKCICYYLGESNSSNNNNHESKSSSLSAAAAASGAAVRDHADDTIQSNPRCPACVQRALKPYLDGHRKAMQDHQKAREECARQLQILPSHHHRLGELQAESQELRNRLATLRKQCADMAVRVASQAVENDARRQETQMALTASVAGNGGNDGSASLVTGTDQAQFHLARLEDSLLEGSLHHALEVASKQVRMLRFQWARKALAMHRLDIDPNDIKMTPLQEKRQHQLKQQKKNHSGDNNTNSNKQHVSNTHHNRRARGIGKIGGLPLPHAGPELYGVLPPKELQSALRLVASVTYTVARCLGIVLPHPILLTPSNSSNSSSSSTSSSGGYTTGDITDTVSDHELQRRLKENHHATSLHNNDPHSMPPPPNHNNHNNNYPPQPVGSSSTASILSLMDTSYWKRSAKKALARATGQTSSSSSSSTSNPQFPASVASMTPSALSSSFSPMMPSSAAASSSSSSFIPPSMDSRQLSLRIHHATMAVLAEDTNPSSSQFALSVVVTDNDVDSMHSHHPHHQQHPKDNDEFAIALQLLQDNIIILCIRAGVPVSKLWPAEAVLLNLYQLDQYCEEQTAVEY